MTTFQRGLKQEEIKLTPKLAMDLLSKNAANRPMSKNYVKQLEGVINRGEWMLNGETLIVDKEGNLLDGQHRCQAVVNTGRSIPAILVTGVERKAFSTLDIGKRRTGSDTLAVLGVENSAVMAAAVRLVLILAEQNPTFHERYSNTQIAEWVNAMGHDLEPFISLANSVYRSQLVDKSTVVGLSYYMAQKDYKLLDDFWERVTDGAGLNKGHPILALRKRLYDHKMGRQRLTKQEMIALIIKAWNKTRKQEMLHPRAGLIWREDESFPKIV